MEISADEIYNFVFKVLTTSKDADSLTMRSIMDAFMKTYDVQSIDEDLKSQIRKNVDKVFAQMNEQEDSENDIQKSPLKANTLKSRKTESKRKRKESESCSEGQSDLIPDHREEKKSKKDSKKQKIEDSDESDFESKISEEKNSNDGTSVKKTSNKLTASDKKHSKRKLYKVMKMEDVSDESDVREKKSKYERRNDSDENKDEERSTGEDEVMDDDRAKENEKKKKRNKKTKSSKDIKDIKQKQDNSSDESDEEKEHRRSFKKKSNKIKSRKMKLNKTNELSDDEDSLMAVKGKLQKFEHSVEVRENEEIHDKTDPAGERQTSTKAKLSTSAIDTNSGSSEDDFEKQKESIKMVKNDHETNDSDKNLIVIKNKLKSFEDSVNKISERQENQSDEDSDEIFSKNQITKSSGGSSSGRKKHSNNESSNDDKVITKNKKHKTTSSGKEDQKSKQKDDSSKLKGLKRYTWKCGIRLNYIKFFDDCRSMKAKERKLENHIKEITGIEGRITLEKCKKYKLKKEEAEEIAELDVSKIIGTPAMGKRLTRQSSSVCKKDDTTSPVGKGVFHNLRDLIDSDESDSEKREKKTKKAVVLDSDSDESTEGEKFSRNISDSSENEPPFSCKKSSLEKEDLSSDGQEAGNIDFNGNKRDSETKGEDSCEETGDDSE